MSGILDSRPVAREGLDLTISSIVAAPLVCLFWRGTFNTITHSAFEGDPTTAEKFLNGQLLPPALALFVSGLVLKILVDLAKHWLATLLLPSDRLTGLTVSTLVIYLDSVSGIMLWVGGFNLLYIFPGTDWRGMVPVLVTASGLLMAARGFHSTVGAPLELKFDAAEEVLRPKGYLGCDASSGWGRLIVDVVFTHGVGHVLNICCWWSLWELENNYILYPCEITVKDTVVWDSVAIGYLAALVVVPLSGAVRAIDDDKHCLRRVAGNCLAWIGLVSSLNVWRGVWSVWDYYFFPSIELQENLILSHFVGFIGLLILRTSATLTQTFTKDSVEVKIYDCEYCGKFDSCMGGLGEYDEEEARPILASHRRSHSRPEVARSSQTHSRTEEAKLIHSIPEEDRTIVSSQTIIRPGSSQPPIVLIS